MSEIRVAKAQALQNLATKIGLLGLHISGEGVPFPAGLVHFSALTAENKDYVDYMVDFQDEAFFMTVSQPNGFDAAYLVRDIIANEETGEFTLKGVKQVEATRLLSVADTVKLKRPTLSKDARLEGSRMSLIKLGHPGEPTKAFYGCHYNEQMFRKVSEAHDVTKIIHGSIYHDKGVFQ